MIEDIELGTLSDMLGMLVGRVTPEGRMPDGSVMPVPPSMLSIPVVLPLSDDPMAFANSPLRSESSLFGSFVNWSTTCLTMFSPICDVLTCQVKVRMRFNTLFRNKVWHLPR
jgi:hypothetical protein